ncbi:MAG TPA: PKD domain-containing protein, partial [Bacteroidia bacterium]|nr:PKD domain-containing protein [Bacteroidia bacterium]
VTVNPIPVTTVNSPTICPTTTATLTAAGATTYLWDTGSTANPLTVSPATTTSYTVTGTSLGCSSTAVATVTVNSALVVNAGLNDSICFGGSAVLGVTPSGAGYLYDWTPTASLVVATSANPTASPATTTTYSVTLTDPSGCTGTSTVTIFADPQITMAIAGIDVICNGACDGQTIVIPSGGTPAYTYLWSSGCTGASCTSLCPGSYTVTVTDSWGCTATGSTSFVEPTLLTASSTVTPASCNGVCDGTATATGAGGIVGTGYTYSWNTVPVQTTATATGLCAGTYTCTVTDANSCTATVTATITEPTLVVTAPIAAATVCTGGSVMITASASGGNGGAYSYIWTPATGLDFTNIANPTATPTATTVYTVNATDVNGCPAAPVNVTVTVNPALSVVASGTASICPGASTNISAVASLGTGGPYTYTWAPAGTGSGTPVSVSPSVTTTYTVTASDGCSPTVTATVTVTVLPLPVVVFSAPVTSGCAPLCVNFTDNSTVAGGAIATWNWDFGDGTSSSVAAPTNCYSVPGLYDITLTVTSTLGGCTSTSLVNNYVTVHPNPVADFLIPASTSIISPTVTYIDNSVGIITNWDWNFGDPFAAAIDSTSTIQNPTHTFTEAGNYCATLTVTTNFGCVSTTTECIDVQPEFTFFMPNAFSPNGDGINDEFYGKGDYIKDFEMFIYDRWGNLTFFADDINKHWDGKANHGKETAQVEVYVYSVKITDSNGKKHKYIGTVTIVK